MEVDDPLDLVLAELDARGLLPLDTEDEVPVVPATEFASKSSMEAGRVEAMVFLFGDLLREAKVPASDEWFGAWLKAVRCRSQLTVEEVAGCCLLQPIEWRLLEERPVQVAATTFTEHVLRAILELFDHRLSEATRQMNRGLDRPSGLAPMMRRTTSRTIGYASVPMLKQPPVPRPVKAKERLQNILERTRALLVAEGREDLL